jgi:hypothetical protein
MKKMVGGSRGKLQGSRIALCVLVTLTEHLHAMLLEDGLKPWRVILDDLIKVTLLRRIVVAHGHDIGNGYISGETVTRVSGRGATVRYDKSLR